MTNPNDNTAEYYDLINQEVKGGKLVLEELNLITTLIKKGGKILDIGCGTGRHLIPLAELGYEMTGVDSSKGMVRKLKMNPSIHLSNLSTDRQDGQVSSGEKLKEKKSKIINRDIFNVNFGETRFDLVILMWNTFNEIALTKNYAGRLIGLFNNILNSNGKVLINIDDPSKIDPEYFEFVLQVEDSNNSITQNWSTKKFYKRTNTSVSEEFLTIRDKNTKKERQIRSFIKQRWWSPKEIRKIAVLNNFRVETKNFGLNDELYLVLIKN